MKAVIQKIILSYFGTFIKGIESDKLSVNLFGGNFQLENISLNHQFFDGLNTPFKLSYSSIGKLNLQAPISKLATQPVQCVLDNIYAVFEFKEGEGNEENKGDKLLTSKKQSFEKYVKEMFQTYLKKLREKQQKKKQDGMMVKLGKKIIDNLQLKIVNVHIRFQEKESCRNYGWGVTLDEISFVTTDKDWKPAFIDRSGQVNKNEKLLKKMNLKKLNVYWHTLRKQDTFVKDLPSEAEKKKIMSDMIQNSQDSILSLTSEAKLIINPDNNLQTPLYEVSIDLQPIKFDLERKQVLEMIDFAQKIIVQNQEMLRNLTLKKKKSVKEMESGEKKKYEEFFSEYVQCIISTKVNESKEIEEFMQNQDNMLKLKAMISKVDSEELMLWALRPIRNYVKIEREKELKKQKKGWFGGQYSLNEEEALNLQKFVEQSIQTTEQTRPPQCLFFSLKIIVNGGVFSFIQHKNLKEQEKIEFKIGRIQTKLIKSANDAILQTELQIGEIGLNLYLPHYDQKEKTKMNILATDIKEEMGEQKKFLILKIIKNIEHSDKPLVNTAIEGELKRVILTYKKIYMQKFQTFFTFENLNDDMRRETARKWDYMKGNNQQNQKDISFEEEKEVQKMFSINLNVISPAVICPLGQEDCWCLNLGQLGIKSKRNEEQEIYPMKVTSAFFRYYPQISFCLKDLQKSYHKKESKFFSVVNNIDFTLIHTYFKKTKMTHTEVMLPNFEVKFTQSQYNNLLTLKNIFKVQESEKNFLDNLKKNRRQVESKMVYSGNIQKKNDNLDTWKNYYGILSGQFIHLYGGEKEVKCLQKISIKHIRLEFVEEMSLISLISQQGIVEIKGSEQERNTMTWKRQIELKMKQYMTLYEIVQNLENMKNEKKQSGKKRKLTSQSSSSDLLKKEKVLEIKINKIGFNYKDNQNKELMNFEIANLMFKEKVRKQQKIRQITFDQLSAIDYIFKYKDADRQSLIYTKNVFFRMSKDKSKKVEVDLDIPQLKINWKPDVLILLFQLLRKHFSKEKVLRVDDDQQKTRTQLFEEVLGNKKYTFSLKQYERNSQNRKVKEKRENYSKKNQWIRELVKVNCKIKRTEIYMIHRQTHLTMFKTLMSDLDTQLILGENEKFVSGSIHSVDLHEMTGYPKKQYKQVNNIEGYKIFERKKQSSEPIITFNYSAYNPHTLPNIQKVDSFLSLQINPINCFYFQQVTFRLIDYILIQVILLLNQPEMLIANEDLLEQLRRKSIGQNLQIQEPVKILFSEYEEIIKKIVDPYFMDIYFKLKEPSITIKSQKDSVSYYRADLQQIVFKNRQVKSYKRFDKCECPDVKKYIYEEEYLIEGKEFNFYTIHKNQVQKLFQPIKLSIVVNKLIQEDQINVIYPQINTYDRSFKTTNTMSKLYIRKCTRQQYLNLNKLVNFNFVFDDNKDELFIHNFKITKILSPKPIFYELLIPGIEMNAKEGTQSQYWDLFQVNINQFKLVYQRNADLNSNFHVWLGNTIVNGCQYLRHENEGKVQKSQLIKIQPSKKSQYCTDILIKMKTTGEKIIESNIENIQANLKIHLLQLIFEWSLLQDWVFPAVSIYANDITFYATIHNMSAWLEEKVPPNSDILPKAFRLLGFFCYKFHRKANYSLQYLQERLKKEQTTVAQINEMPEASYMTILLNTEMYHCLSSEKEKIKRQVVEKLTLNMIEKRLFKVANEQLSIIKTVANRKLNLDKGLLKISFTDVQLMNRIFSVIAKERQYIQYLREKTKKDQPLILQKETQISSLQKIDIQAQSLSIYLINNFRSTFIPILRLNFTNVSLSKCNTSKKDLFKGTLDAAISYFNATIFRWQPVLQKTQLSFHKLNYVHDESVQNVFSSIQATKPILLNITKEMVSALKQIMRAWQKSKQQKELLQTIIHHKQLQKKQEKVKHVESIELVSQYVIRNQIGYTIEIFDSKRQLKYQIKANTERDYEYQLQNYDEDEDREILIGINILHPKYKFQRITHIPLDLSKQFQVLPLIVDRTQQQTRKILPRNSFIIFHPETKNSKRHLILKTTKIIQNYIEHRLIKNFLPFDHYEKIPLHQSPHNGIQVSLFQTKKSKDSKYRYVGNEGTLKILTKYLVYNYTPIPLQICQLLVFPGDFASISEDLTIQNVKYRDCQVIKVDYNEKKKQYYITCGGYLVDYYGLYFDFGHDSKLFSHQSIHNGFKFTIYLISDSQSKFKVKLKKNYKSTNSLHCSAMLKPIVGNQMFSLQSPDNSLCDFSMYGYLSRFSFVPNSDFKKIIEITPCFILSNSTKFKVKVCQLQSCQSMTLQSYERVPFFWENRHKPKFIKIAVFDGEEMWGYSGPLKINQSTQSFVIRKASNVRQYKLMSIELQNTNTINFIHLIENQARDCQNIILSNQVKGLNLRFYQTSIFESDSELMNPYECFFRVKTGEQVPFGYELPMEKHEVTMEVQFIPDPNGPYHNASCSPVILTQIENNLFQKHISIYRDKKRIKKLLLKLGFEGNVKKLKLLEKDDEELQENKGQFICKIPEIGISLIGYKQKVRKQIIFINIQGLQLEKTTTDQSTQYGIMVKSFKIQNQIKSKAIYPVLLQQIKPQQFFLNFLLIKDSKNSKLIHYIGLSINNFNLSLTSEEIQYIQQNTNELMNAWNTEVANEETKIIRDYELFRKGKPIIEGNLYFVEAQIHPLKSIVTFKHVNNWGGRILKTFSSLDDCKISVDGKKITHFSCKNISEFLKHVMKHYQDGVYKMIIPVLGNLSILGSPVSLAQRIGSGFKDLIQLPSEGFTRSPLQGGKGLAKGAGSLVKNTFEGAFNSVQSISGSVGNGLSSLAFDEDYSKERQKIKNQKSDHLGIGLMNGAKSIANGVGRGITGLVTSPVEGAQENGIGGFFLGGLKGITGLVVKPVSGIIDATTKTFEGIKNTPGFIKQVGNKKQKNKGRHPRVFYNYSREYRTFDQELALCAKILIDHDEEKYENLSWYGIYFLSSEKEEKKPIIFLTYEYFIIYNLKIDKIIQSYKTEDIHDAQAINKDKLRIKIYDRKKKEFGHIDFILKNQLAKRFEAELKIICKYYRPVYGFDYKLNHK